MLSKKIWNLGKCYFKFCKTPRPPPPPNPKETHHKPYAPEQNHSHARNNIWVLFKIYEKQNHNGKSRKQSKKETHANM